MRELHALAGGTLWLLVLFYMRGFRSTENAVPIISKICIDVWPYLIVLSSILIGCAFIFMNLQRHISGNALIKARYFSAQSSLLSSFSMMMGGFDVEDFTSSGESVMVFITFMIFVQLVMLNMLVSIMGDSVAAVKSQGGAAGDAARAELVMEISTFMTEEEAHDEKNFPRTFTLDKCEGLSARDPTTKTRLILQEAFQGQFVHLVSIVPRWPAVKAAVCIWVPCCLC